MSRLGAVLGRRTLWTTLVGLVALAFWVVAFGVGWRAWLLTGPDLGIVAHVDAFGLQAAPWGIVAAILTLTTVVMGVGTAVTRHLVDGVAVRQPMARSELAAASAPPALGSPVDDGPGDDQPSS